MWPRAQPRIPKHFFPVYLLTMLILTPPLMYSSLLMFCVFSLFLYFLIAFPYVTLFFQSILLPCYVSLLVFYYFHFRQATSAVHFVSNCPKLVTAYRNRK